MPSQDELIEKMEELSWKEIQKKDPVFAQAYLEAFRSISIGPDIFKQFAHLRRQLGKHTNQLASQGKISNFDQLRSHTLQNHSTAT